MPLTALSRVELSCSARFAWKRRGRVGCGEGALPFLPIHGLAVLTPPPTRAQAKQLAGASLTFTFLDALLQVGEHTALVEVIFGHEDHFGTSVGKLIENKMVLHRGGVHPSRRRSDLPAIGDVPEGALAIPRYKVCTIIGSLQDVELHELHGVFHAGRSTQALASPYP